VYLNYQSAPMLTRPTNSTPAPALTQFLGRGPGGSQLKKNADGSYMSPWSVDWTDNSGVHHTDPLDINCHCFDPTKTVVFNPAAWENVAPGQWADQSGLRFYRGVRLPQENVNFSRNFRIKERVQLNLRVEFNNIFNRLQLPTPVGGAVTALAPANFSLAPTKIATGPNTGLYASGFGTFTAAGSSILTNGTGGQRIGTFVARITF